MFLRSNTIRHAIANGCTAMHPCLPAELLSHLAVRPFLQTNGRSARHNIAILDVATDCLLDPESKEEGRLDTKVRGLHVRITTSLPVCVHNCMLLQMSSGDGGGSGDGDRLLPRPCWNFTFLKTHGLGVPNTGDRRCEVPNALSRSCPHPSCPELLAGGAPRG